MINSLILETMSIIIKVLNVLLHFLKILYYKIINVPTNKLFYILINTLKQWYNCLFIRMKEIILISEKL